MAVSPIHMNDSLLILRLKYGSECTLVGHSGMNADGRLPHWAGGHPHVRSQAGCTRNAHGGASQGERAGRLVVHPARIPGGHVQWTAEGHHLRTL